MYHVTVDVASLEDFGRFIGFPDWWGAVDGATVLGSWRLLPRSGGIVAFELRDPEWITSVRFLNTADAIDYFLSDYFDVAALWTNAEFPDGLVEDTAVENQRRAEWEEFWHFIQLLDGEPHPWQEDYESIAQLRARHGRS